jgi:hypothetical protein
MDASLSRDKAVIWRMSAKLGNASREELKMRYSTAMALCLAGFFANAPAEAGVVGFSFGAGASGTFTTGAASPTDPGYELITGLTFDVLSGNSDDGFPFSFINLGGSGFQPGAAFNPSTDAFINHAGGNTSDDIGMFSLNTESPLSFPSSIDGNSFSLDSRLLSGVISDASDVNTFVIYSPLVINIGGTQAPEPSTWAMLLLGFAGLGFAGYWASRRTATARRMKPIPPLNA